MARALLPLFLLSGCIGGAPLSGRWAGDMEVTFGTDTRTFTIEIERFSIERNCYEGSHDVDGCVVQNFRGAWDEYESQAHFGGEIETNGLVSAFHCTADDCVFVSATGVETPIEEGWVMLTHGGADYQTLTLTSVLEPGRPSEITGDAVYAYKNGQMIGTFQISRP